MPMGSSTIVTLRPTPNTIITSPAMLVKSCYSLDVGRTVFC
jgi:hypothetical protein